MLRYSVPNKDIAEAAQLLDDNGIPYNFDSSNRFMINEEYAEEAMELWGENEIDYDEI